MNKALATGSEAGDLESPCRHKEGPEAPEAGLGSEQAGPTYSSPLAEGPRPQLGAGRRHSVKEGRTVTKSARGASICPDSQQLQRVIARLLQMHLLQGLEAGDLFTGKSILITRLSLA